MVDATPLVALGQRFLIRARRYRVAGRVDFAGSDGDWTEWLLVLEELSPSAAVGAGKAQWLERDEDRWTLWTPVALPPELARADVASITELAWQGRRYRVEERGSASVRRIAGDVGGDCRPGDRFDFVDFSVALASLSLEVDASGRELSSGRRVSDRDLTDWNLELRAAAAAEAAAAGSGRRSAAPGSPLGKNLSDRLQLVIVGLFAAALIAFGVLVDNDDDDDCSQRYDEASKQYEQVCSDGVRRTSSRPFHSSGGK